MIYLTDFSTASKRLNLNNPIQGTVRFRSVGHRNTLHSSVSKRRDMDTIWQKSVISCIRAKYKGLLLSISTFQQIIISTYSNNKLIASRVGRGM